MIFRAKNLGPLREVEVDLGKNLIVLAGPNNSGKTYLAWTVYGLHREPIGPKADLSLWAQQLLDSPDYTIDLGTLVREQDSALCRVIAEDYQKRLHHCFAAERERFEGVEIGFQMARLRPILEDAGREYRKNIFSVLSSPMSEPFEFAQYFIGPEWDRIGVAAIQPNAADFNKFASLWSKGFLPDPNSIAAMTAALGTLKDAQRMVYRDALQLRLRETIKNGFFSSCTLFPAERIAVNLFSKELTLKRSEIVDTLVDADLDNQKSIPMDFIRNQVGRYPWPIRDSLKVANDLSNLSKRKSPFASLADEIETAVLGGGVGVSENGEMLFSPGDKSAAGLPMQLTASIVKSLSSLVFYFRHLAQPGDFLIIDEPELNLHPDNQRKITRILAKAVRLGFRIMISTHSDYVLRELNHLLMLNKLGEGEVKELGYDPQSALSPEQLGVYLFHEQHVAQVPIEETGFSIKTIDEVVNQLNADEQKLYARLFSS